MTKDLVLRFAVLMKISAAVLSGVLLVDGVGSKAEASVGENALLGYNHLLPSPFTLPQGRFVLGSTAGIGITDFMDIQTNVVADIYQVYNGRLGFSLLDFPGLAVGLGLGYQHTDLYYLSNSNPNLTFHAWTPSIVIAAEVLPYVSVALGGNLFWSNLDFDTFTVRKSGYMPGKIVEADLSWAYLLEDDMIRNVISAGVTYNTTFNYYGVGASHHWRGLHVGLHVFPNADDQKWLPILSLGWAAEF